MRADCRPAQSAALAALLLAMLALVELSTSASATGHAERRAPDFTLTDALTSDSLSLSGFESSPVLLFFFDAGDMQSLSAIAYVNEWHRRYEGDGLKVLGIHSSRFEPLKLIENIFESTSRRKAAFAFGVDSEGSICSAYSIASLPSYVLLREGLQIALETSAPRPYVDVERAIQQVLAATRPKIKNPFLVKPLRPVDDPANKILKATPQVLLGYLPGAIVGCDSAARDTFYNYTDSGDRQRGRVYLHGYWKVGPSSVSHVQRLGSSGDHLRIIYSGKEVWILPSFAYGYPQRIYVKQDRVYADKSIWGKDMYGDEVGLPYIRMKYSVPVHVITNRAFGSHELELIPAEGDVAFYYIFFEDGVAE